MKKLLLAVLVALLGLPAAAQTIPLFTDYDLDATTYVYPVLCTPGPAVQTAATCPGQGKGESKKLTTAGVSTTTVTSVATNGAFTSLLAGDEIEVSLPALASLGTGRARRLLTARASADSVTVDTAIQIESTGAPFVWWKFYKDATAEDGWFSVGDAKEFTLFLGISQADVTGGIDYKAECRESYLDRKGPVALLAGPTNVTTFPLAATRILNVYNERYAECRVGIKIGTSDDGADTTTHLEKVTLWIEKGGAQ
jgi:hypothetical protein